MLVDLELCSREQKSINLTVLKVDILPKRQYIGRRTDRWAQNATLLHPTTAYDDLASTLTSRSREILVLFQRNERHESCGALIWAYFFFVYSFQPVPGLLLSVKWNSNKSKL